MIHPEQLNTIYDEVVKLYSQDQRDTNRRIALVFACPDTEDPPIAHIVARIANQPSQPSEKQEDAMEIHVYLDNGSRWVLNDTIEVPADEQALIKLVLAPDNLLDIGTNYMKPLAEDDVMREGESDDE